MPSLPSLPRLGAGLGAGALRAVALAVVGVLVIAAVVTLWPGADQKTLTASFPRTVSIYEGSSVRVLGVPIGQVETVEPAGTMVKVTMTYDPEVKVPEDVKAAVVAPSVVGDRFIQLTPVYTKGPELADGATLSEDRTAVPLELDQIYQSIDDLAVALGPEGANKDGALTRLLDSTARNFGGQGAQFNETVRNLSRFTTTLDTNKDALFGTAREVERFVQALAENDQTVRDFNDSLAGASSTLEQEREELSAALRNLGVAMQEVSTFVKENESALSHNVKGLRQVSDVLVRQREHLEEVLEVAPTALSNLYHTYNPKTGTLDARANLSQNIENPIEAVCTLIGPLDPDSEPLCNALREIPGLSNIPARRAAPGGTAPASRRAVEIEHVDTTLGGILGEPR